MTRYLHDRRERAVLLVKKGIYFGEFMLLWQNSVIYVSVGFLPPCWCTSRCASAWCLHTNLYKIWIKNIFAYLVSEILLWHESCRESFHVFFPRFWSLFIERFWFFWFWSILNSSLWKRALHWKPAMYEDQTVSYSGLIVIIICSASPLGPVF